MGQKVNPHGMRVGVIKDWDSRWYASNEKVGDLLVEGRIPIYNDSGELVNYRNCYADADVLGITSYAYQDIFPLAYEDKVFTGEEKNSYELRLFQKRFRLPFGENAFALSDTFTTELPVRLGESFYLPLVLVKEVSKGLRVATKGSVEVSV